MQIERLTYAEHGVGVAAAAPRSFSGEDAKCEWPVLLSKRNARENSGQAACAKVGWLLEM
jgi:hypothetical protein